MRVKELLYGAAYYDEYMPCDRIETDFSMMERAGMNVVRIAESTWSTLEPQEGVYNFSHIDRMLTCALEHGLSVIVGTPSYAIPAWLAKKSEDILALTHDGPSLYGHRQNMDLTSPLYRKHCENIIRVLMEHVKDHPAIIGYQLDNETKPYDTCGPRAQAMFVDYLKDRYPDINEFNREFGLDYWSNRIDDWADFPDIRGTINGSLAAEYEKFQRKLVTDFFAWQAAIVSEYKRDDQFLTHNFDFAWHNYSYGLQPDCDQFSSAKIMTVAGADIYHPSGADLTGTEITVCGNITRGLKKDNYLILETEAQGNLGWLPYPGQLRLQAYSHIANGANSVMYWHWHSIHNSLESYWKGVLSHDLAENETYRDCMVIGNEFRRLSPKLRNLKKKNRAAIMVNQESCTGFKYFPASPAGESPETDYNTFFRFLADSLYRLNVEFDVIHSCDPGLSQYDFILIPALYSASEQELSAIEQYVACGGHILATFRTGFCDKNLKIYHDTQPHILNRCLGIHYDQFTVPKDVVLTGLHKTHGTAADCPSGSFDSLTQQTHSVPAKYWMELVSCDTAEKILSYSHPYWNRYAAATHNRYHTGTASYLACYFEDKALLDALMEELLADAGIQVPEEHFPVIKKAGINEAGHKVSFFFNFSGEPQTAVYKESSGKNLFTEALVSENDVISLAPWDLAIIESDC